jgi:hypothetical protein
VNASIPSFRSGLTSAGELRSIANLPSFSLEPDQLQFRPQDLSLNQHLSPLHLHPQIWHSNDMHSMMTGPFSSPFPRTPSAEHSKLTAALPSFLLLGSPDYRRILQHLKIYPPPPPSRRPQDLSLNQHASSLHPQIHQPSRTTNLNNACTTC